MNSIASQINENAQVFDKKKKNKKTRSSNNMENTILSKTQETPILRQ